MIFSKIFAFFIEFILSYLFKNYIKNSFVIGNNIEVSNAIYNAISYLLLVVSLINFVQVLMSRFNHKKIHKISTIENIFMYIGCIIIASLGWFILNNIYIWIGFIVVMIALIVYYITNYRYINLNTEFKNKLICAIQSEFGLNEIKSINIINSNVCTVKNCNDNYFVVISYHKNKLDFKKPYFKKIEKNKIKTLDDLDFGTTYEYDFIVYKNLSLFKQNNLIKNINNQ